MTIVSKIDDKGKSEINILTESKFWLRLVTTETSKSWRKGVAGRLPTCEDLICYQKLHSPYYCTGLPRQVELYTVSREPKL